MAEHRSPKPRAAGSIPVSPAIIKQVTAQVCAVFDFLALYQKYTFSGQLVDSRISRYISQVSKFKVIYKTVLLSVIFFIN